MVGAAGELVGRGDVRGHRLLHARMIAGSYIAPSSAPIVIARMAKSDRRAAPPATLRLAHGLVCRRPVAPLPIA